MNADTIDDAKVLFAELHNQLAEAADRLGEIEFSASKLRAEINAGQVRRSKLEALIFDGRWI